MLDQKDLEAIGKLLQPVNNRLDGMDKRLNGIDNRLDEMDNRLESVENSITDVKLHLENVTDKNIRIVAEGHLDLNRKLDEALKIQNEKEILQIRLNYLEGEITAVKNRLAQLEQTA